MEYPKVIEHTKFNPDYFDLISLAIEEYRKKKPVPIKPFTNKDVKRYKAKLK